jgi:hypothetical protein
MILYSRLEFARYKRRAIQHYPVEYAEMCFGTVTGNGLCIERLVAAPQYGNKYYCNWRTDQEAEDVIAEIEASGLEYIGSIHSHTMTHREAHVPSALDNKTAYLWEERVFVLDHILKHKGRFKHSIAFYEPQTPLEDVAGF